MPRILLHAVMLLTVLLMGSLVSEAQRSELPVSVMSDTRTPPSTYPTLVPGQKTASISDDVEVLSNGLVRVHVIVGDGDAPAGSQFTRHTFDVAPAEANAVKIADLVRGKIAPAQSLTRGPLDLTPP